MRSASADRGLTTRLPGLEAILPDDFPEDEPASGRSEKVPSTSERRCLGAGGTGGSPVGRLSTRRSVDPDLDLSDGLWPLSDGPWLLSDEPWLLSEEPWLPSAERRPPSAEPE